MEQTTSRPARRWWGVAGPLVVALLLGGGIGWGLGQRAAENDSAALLASGEGDGSTSTTDATAEAAGPLRRLFLRTTEAGVAIRAYADDAANLGVVELSTEAAVATATLGGGEGGVIGTGRFGTREGAPVAWVAVVAFEGRLRASAGGAADEMAPTNGIAVLAVPTAADSITLETVDPSGAVTATESVIVLDEEVAPPSTTTTITPPPTTTAPTTTTPPASPPSAEDEAGIRAAYAQAFTGTNGPEANLAAVEGGEALGPTLAAVTRNFPEAVRTVTPEVWDVQVMDADRAVLGFELSYTGGVQFGPQDGLAVRVDGTWLVARTTYCKVMGWGGGSCP